MQEMTLPDKDTKNANTDSILNQKWGSQVMSVGYTVVPSAIVQAQSRLHLNAVQFNVLLHLLDMWWRPSDMPWPSKKTIAERMGVNGKTVQRAIVTMEQEGLLKRHNRFTTQGGRASNRYDLTPLVDKLKIIAGDILEIQKSANQAKAKVRKPSFRKPNK